MLIEGNLTVHCELTIHGTRKISSGLRNIEDRSKTRAKGLEQASEQFGKLFTDKDFADVELECDGEVFHCHQLILSARSDVFRAMFQNDMKESRSKKVAIEDVDPKVLGEMLHYIYTGLTNKDLLEEKARDLLSAANRYQLGLLKNICEDQLCSALNLSNCIKHLIFGDLYQASKLRRMSLVKIARNMTKLVATEDYENLVKNHPVLATEIPAAMVEVMTKK